MDWFSVDKAGLAKLLDKRGKSFAIFELIQNAWDTSAKTVRVNLEPIPGKPYAKLYVEDDDPDGFKNLTHAFTLFAESEKKGDPTKRGRFNLGEKLVLALCESAEIISTTGSVYFTREGRSTSKKKLQKGSAFLGIIRMTREELLDVNTDVGRLLPPEGSVTYFNHIKILGRNILRSFQAQLPTEIADEEGYLRRTTRTTTVTVHEPSHFSEKPMLYEMGIPVVELTGGERWHINVHQKIPLNVDRDNVTPAYLQTLRVLLANEMKSHLTANDATMVWVDAATADDRIDSKAVETVLDHRFGTKRVIFDASDPEANKQLMNEGFNVIHGGSLSKGQWDNVKAASLALPAGQLRPSGVHYSTDGKPEKVIPESEYTTGQRALVEFSKDLANKLIGADIYVRIVNEPITRPHAAWYGKSGLTFNLGRLGKAWFEEGLRRKHLELILHELAHDLVSDHLTREFADEVGRLSTRLVDIALLEPSFLKYHGYQPE